MKSLPPCGCAAWARSEATMALAQIPSILVAFPRADLRHTLGAAMNRHRLPEGLAQDLVRDAGSFPDLPADAALACALTSASPPPRSIWKRHAASCWSAPADRAKARSPRRSPALPA